MGINVCSTEELPKTLSHLEKLIVKDILDINSLIDRIIKVQAIEFYRGLTDLRELYLDLRNLVVQIDDPVVIHETIIAIPNITRLTYLYVKHLVRELGWWRRLMRAFGMCDPINVGWVDDLNLNIRKEVLKINKELSRYLIKEQEK